jgi:hypothetical protein
MRAWSFLRHGARAVVIAIVAPAVAAGQAVPAGVPAPTVSSRLAMADAVRLALVRNHQLRAQWLNVDLSKADEITAALKPNPVLTSTNENFPVWSPSDLFSRDNFLNNQNFVESVSYLFESGGKREKRRRWHRTRPRPRRRRSQTRSASWCSRPGRRSSTCCWSTRPSSWRART